MIPNFHENPWLLYLSPSESLSLVRIHLLSSLSFTRAQTEACMDCLGDIVGESGMSDTVCGVPGLENPLEPHSEERMLVPSLFTKDFRSHWSN
jgi:hypothetical protein